METIGLLMATAFRELVCDRSPACVQSARDIAWYGGIIRPAPTSYEMRSGCATRVCI
jgi:hypothetical protein